ncbi:DUF7471 family protein [Natronosalvus vescus]|uniref:DUF7471 family protein n=1 Tax=Natronosalvus vescus TaxID=2953881 RepID=UPI0020912E3D|nr:hypothetical protein [Natronosalvus vescus]
MYSIVSPELRSTGQTTSGSIQGWLAPVCLETAIESERIAGDWYLLLLLALSGIVSVVVFLLAASAFRRRKSVPYLLITAALGALLVRPIVGTGTVFGYVSMRTHHTVEHLLDVLIAGFLLMAIISVGRLEPNRSDPDGTPDGGERR